MSESTKQTSFWKKNGKKVLLVILALALAGGGVFWFLRGRSGSRKAYVIPVASVSSNAMANGTSNRFTGVVEPQKTKDIQADSMKTVDEVYVKVGDEVTAGQKLFSYRIEDMELDLQQLNVDLQNYYRMIEDYNEQIRQIRSSGGSEYDVQIINMQISNVQADIQKKRNEINAKQRDMAQAYVTSPIDGVVKEINDPQSVTYSGSGAFMTIIADGEFLIKCKISEMNVYEIGVEETVIIRSRVDETKTWKGTIVSIDTGSPITEENPGYYGGNQESGAKYAFMVKPESAEGLLLGQHVTVEKAASSSRDTKGILLNSGFIVDAEGKPYVWADRNGRLRKVYVTLGTYKEDSDEYDVTSGITAEDLIAFPDEGLKEGMKTTTEYRVEDDPDLGTGVDMDDLVPEDSMTFPEEGGQADFPDDTMTDPVEGFEEPEVTDKWGN